VPSRGARRARRFGRLRPLAGDKIGVVSQTFDVDAVVLRGIRFGEADTVLSILTPDLGRLSAIGKGARRPRSRLAGRLQPGVRSRMTLHRGRGDMATVRGAMVIEANAGLWERGHRLRAAGCVLEGALRTLPEGVPDEGAFNLVCRALALLAHAPTREVDPRLDPVVLGLHAKMLVVAGLVPRLGPCEACAPGAAMVAFSARSGGALCRACAAGAEPFSPKALATLAGLLGRPLAEAEDVLAPTEADEVERLISLILLEHLGVELRSAAPVR
jgi:DNA repair protein RecO (recombination protein O)